MMVEQREKKQSRVYKAAAVMLIAGGVLLNVLMSMMIREMELPLFIDTVGTVFVTALGGLMPGILTALATNVFNFIMDGESIFYAFLNMLIALASFAFFSGKKKRGPLNTMLFICGIAFIGGVIGSQVSWFLYGAPSDTPMMRFLVNDISKRFGVGEYAAFTLASYAFDVIDKAISVVLALGLSKMVPAKLRPHLELTGWLQKPLTAEEQKSVQKNLRGRISISTRTTIVLVSTAFFIALIISIFALINYRGKTLEWIEEDSRQTAYLAAKCVDAERIDEFIEYGDDAEGYEETKEKLTEIKLSSEHVAFLYVYKLEDKVCRVVFDLDALLADGSFVKGDRPGQAVDYEEALFPYIDSMKNGEVISVRMKDSYGKFLATYHPIRDLKGNCVAYAVSNVELDLVDSIAREFIGKVLLLFAGFFILVTVFSIWTSKYHIVMPIVGLTGYVGEYAFNVDKDESEKMLKRIESLDIRTKDEIELLYKAFRKLTGDTVAQMNDARAKSEAIARMQNGLIITMADMVESRDSDTGAHVQKTAAYVRIILKGLKKNGYYAEKLTDKYMNDVELSAPLHDVGKINIPDAVLNKPGKLTDEEFEIMKTHTTAGKNILENAMITVEGDNYLKEARNMAAYHHERWDGKGYPEGLHGQVIPLSARVMAVADVFDALTSPRVYKPAFPLEKALQIMQEGAGSQFDPKCIEVFMEALPEVKKVLKKYQEKK